MVAHNLCVLLLMVSLIGLASPARPVCSNSTFTCTDGRCISQTWRCDGDYDCINREDEMDCPKTCGENEFKCGSKAGKPDINPSTDCIPLKWKCDGEFDCEDRSDEANCEKVVCNENQFACTDFEGKFNLCISLSWKCDGQRDCASGADEEGCSKEKSCGDEFDCGNTVCIFPSWKCDGEDDCGNGADESNCTLSAHSKCQGADVFKCHEGETCIPKDWVCDGEADCHDRSDETNCGTGTSHTCLLSTEFACSTGKTCINKLWVCDGEADCPDKSDELNCNFKSVCDAKEKKCASAERCLPETLWCNGIEDCPGGEDELDCESSNETVSTACEEGRDFSCPSAPSMCIPMNKICTAKSLNCGDDLTCAKDIRFCQESSSYCNCRKMYSPNNHTVCSCADGFVLKDKRCIDINECETPGRCDQICTNKPGSYACSCHAHYKLSYRGEEIIPSKCRALGVDPLVLLSNRATIRQFDMISQVHLPLIQSPGSAVAMDFHMKNGVGYTTLIWSDISLRKIMTCQIGAATQHHHLAVKDKCAEGEQSVLVEGDVHTPDGLAVDWVHDLLFWTDGALDQISVMDMKTRKRRVLFSDQLEEPRAIAVDPEMGLIFWTDWGKEARIERAGMDGMHRMVVQKGDAIKWPNGLALDLLEKRIYWADAKVKSIFSSDYYGTDMKVVLHSHSDLRHPFSLAVFEDRVYYTDWEHDGVISVNKVSSKLQQFTGANVTKLMSSVTTPMTVRIYHNVTQPEHPNKCLNNKCKELCLPKASIRSAKPISSRPIDVPFTCLCEGDALSDRAECVADMVTGSHLFSWVTMLVFLVISIAVVAAFVVERQRRRSSKFSPLTFDNPVYRRTVEDGDEMEGVRMSRGMVEMELPPQPPFLDIDNDRNTMIEPMEAPLTT